MQRIRWGRFKYLKFLFINLFYIKKHIYLIRFLANFFFKIEFDSRLQYNKQQQKRWLEEQMYENEMKRKRENEEDRLYAEQTLANNRMRLGK